MLPGGCVKFVFVTVIVPAGGVKFNFLFAREHFPISDLSKDGSAFVASNDVKHSFP